MTGRRENRIRAYGYVIEQIREVNQDVSRRPDRVLGDFSYISLDELVRLGEGIADPSRELVAALKKLLGAVASEHEINECLVAPFMSEA
ncbi:MAG: hypothetical protein KJ624_03655 [Chloroflexi bacterium]|nr:hypothetical protein [Chloroflexota bacterium]